MCDTEEKSNKFSELENTMKQLDRLKEGSIPEKGKVTALAAHLANIHQEPEKPPLQKSVSNNTLLAFCGTRPAIPSTPPPYCEIAYG